MTANKVRPVIYSSEFLIGGHVAAVVACVAMGEWWGVLGFTAALMANLRAREIENSQRANTAQVAAKETN